MGLGGIELATLGFAVGLATDCATGPGRKFMSNFPLAINMTIFQSYIERGFYFELMFYIPVNNFSVMSVLARNV